MAYDTSYFDDIFKSILGSAMPMGGTRDMGMPMGGGAMPFAPEPMASPNIPMPQPRPMEANALPPLETRDIPMGGPAPATFGAPPAGNIAPPQRPMDGISPSMMPQSPMGGGPESSGILGSMFGMSPESARTLRGSIAGGMKGIANGWNKPAMAAFASGAGGALEGGEQAEKYTDKRGDLAREEARAEKVKLVELAIKSRAEGDYAGYQKAIVELKTRELEEVKKAAEATKAVRAGTDATYKAGRLDIDSRKADTDETYKAGRNEIGNRNADSRAATAAARTKEAEAYARPDGSSRTGAKTIIETERLLQRDKDKIYERNGVNDKGLKPEEAAKRKAAADAEFETRKQELRTQLAPSMPAAPTLSKPGEISMMGNGTQAQPYRPTTPEEYATIDVGTHYIKNGKIYLKGNNN